tara:strand:- start:179 stop:358 length:180 start_codon:yes stop_codon:yes gene_type:complete
MNTPKGEPQEQQRLYKTDKEERIYRELKEKYGIKDAVVVKGHSGDRDDESQGNHVALQA